MELPLYFIKNGFFRVVQHTRNMTTEKALFGAGCFWGVQYKFDQIPGVVSTRVGYSGGDFDNPTYKDVCTNKTGHAEVVQVTYDPSVISYKEILEIFWKIHDPTTLNQQGPDIGTQYRSVVFYYNDEQKEAALKYRDELNKSGKFRNPIVTQLVPVGEFWEAEEYHQKYHEKNRRRTILL